MTRFVKNSEIESSWYEIDAKDAVVGRLAAIISKIIRGKNKNTYTPHMDHGDYVIVKNEFNLEYVQFVSDLLEPSMPNRIIEEQIKKTNYYTKKHNIKKVVLTSSVAAIFDTMEKKSYYDESDWSDPNNPAISHYSKSKTLAERAAWDFVENEGHPFELAVINPALVVGSSLSGDIGESNKAVQMVASGKMPVAVPLMFGYVDVKDVAAAHILAMQTPASNGERFALAEKDLWYKDVAKLLRENGFEKAPTIGIPVWLAKIMANFSKELKLTLPYLGRLRSVKHTSKAKDILGWNPRPAEESIVEIANQMKELGMLK